MERREYLLGLGGVAALLGPRPDRSQLKTPTEGWPWGDWLSATDNFDGLHDATGNDVVTVTVGARGNGDSFAFEPAAVAVDPGTTIVWAWTGRGGRHNVRAIEGASFESPSIADGGHTFTRSFEEDAVVTYICDFHAALGMRGAVVVGDPSAADADSGPMTRVEGVPFQPHFVGIATFLGAILTLVFSFFVLKYGEPEPPGPPETP